MSQTQLPRHEEGELEQRIARCILERTGRRVHDLWVRVTTEGVQVKGYAFSYHALQLALVGRPREILDTTPVRMDIAVLADNPRSPGAAPRRGAGPWINDACRFALLGSAKRQARA